MSTEMQKFKLITAMAATMTMGAISPANAASENECAIWICLPGGFPAGCGSAYSAMINRVKHRKPPLPNFSACAVNPPIGSGSHMNFDYGLAALIAAKRTCEKWAIWRGETDICSQWKTIPQHYVKGSSCTHNDGGENPPGCIATKMYGDVFIEGMPAGPTFYW